MSTQVTSLAKRLRKLIDPATCKDPGAKEGSEWLVALDDSTLVDTFRRLCEKNEPVADVQRRLQFEGVSGQRALMRLTMLGRGLSLQQQEEQHIAQQTSQEVKPSRPVFSPQFDFQEVYAECEKAPADLDATRNLAKLLMIQEKRLYRMLEEQSRMPSGFLSASVVNSTIDHLRRLNESLLHAQIATGLVEKQPDELQIKLPSAFQAYVGGLEGTDKDAMAGMMKGFVSLMEEKYLLSEDGVDASDKD